MSAKGTTFTTADPFNKPVSDPSQAKRAKLRAKRKKRN
jgi:hypothetical protein